MSAGPVSMLTSPSSGRTWLKTITASQPLSSAFWNLSAKPQAVAGGAGGEGSVPPRSISATSSVSGSASSAGAAGTVGGSQPLPTNTDGPLICLIG